LPRATRRYQPLARADTSKKSRDDQAGVLSRSPAASGYSKFFVSFVCFVVNFTGFS
jgi:hypothetical protein